MRGICRAGEGAELMQVRGPASVARVLPRGWCNAAHPAGGGTEHAGRESDAVPEMARGRPAPVLDGDPGRLLLAAIFAAPHQRLADGVGDAVGPLGARGRDERRARPVRADARLLPAVLAALPAGAELDARGQGRLGRSPRAPLLHRLLHPALLHGKPGDLEPGGGGVVVRGAGRLRAPALAGARVARGGRAGSRAKLTRGGLASKAVAFRERELFWRGAGSGFSAK